MMSQFLKVKWSPLSQFITSEKFYCFFHSLRGRRGEVSVYLPMSISCHGEISESNFLLDWNQCRLMSARSKFYVMHINLEKDESSCHIKVVSAVV